MTARTPSTRGPLRPARSLLLLALALALLLAIGAAPTTAHAAEPDGTPGVAVGGSQERTTATPLAAGARYLDSSITDDAPRYFRIDRTMPGSTIDVGVSAASVPSGENLRIDARLETLDGEQCADGTATPTIGADVDSDASVSLSASPLRPASGECGAETSIVLTVEVLRPSSTASADDTIDLELLVGEEPPAANLDALPAPETETPKPAPLPAADGSGGTLAPGGDYASAPLIESGSYTGTISPDSTQYLTVPLDYGQRLTVNARFDAVDGAATGSTPDAALVIRNPYRGIVSPSEVRDADGNGASGELSSTAATSLTAVSLDVNYRSRGLEFGDGRTGSTEVDATTAGPYTIALGLTAPDWGEPAAQYAYTLTLQVSGEAGVGAPEFTEGAALVPWPVDPVGPPAVAVGLAIAGAVLVFGGATALVLLLARRRSSH